MSMGIYLRRASENQIAHLKAAPEGWEDFAWEGNPRDMAGFDKNWAALHFVLTGGADGEGPLAILVKDFEVLGANEFLPLVNVIAPDQVRACNEALSALDDAVVISRYDPAQMLQKGLYFAEFFVARGDAGLEYILEGLQELRRFCSLCADAGDGAIRIMG